MDELSFSDDEEITIQQAADLLNVSGAYVGRLVDRGDLASHPAGPDRRLRLVDVVLYRLVDQARRLAAIDALAGEAQDLDLY